MLWLGWDGVLQHIQIFYFIILCFINVEGYNRGIEKLLTNY